MANVVEEMVGTREAEAAEVATESGGTLATESGGAVATECGGAVATECGEAVAIESGGAATTGDATAGDDTAAICGVMYAAEGPYTIDVRHVEAMVGKTREAEDGDRVPRGRDRGRDRRSQGRDRRQERRRRLVTNETAATGGVMYTDEDELEFDDDELTALEGQRLRFSCGIY